MGQATVTVTNWGAYQPCNIFGGEYHCAGDTPSTKDTLPGKEMYGYNPPGYWYSFPAASEGHTWSQKLERRIKATCLAQAWRKAAGGCPGCGEEIDSCVGSCIKDLDADK